MYAAQFKRFLSNSPVTAVVNKKYMHTLDNGNFETVKFCYDGLISVLNLIS